MTILIKVLQFIMALSVLIILHELGHFLAAKSFKTRVDKFYLFFDWGFSLFRMKKVNGKKQAFERLKLFIIRRVS